MKGFLTESKTDGDRSQNLFADTYESMEWLGMKLVIGFIQRLVKYLAMREVVFAESRETT